MKTTIEQLIKRVGHPVAVYGVWDDQPIYYFVRGRESFLLLDINSPYNRGAIHLYRRRIKVERNARLKRFFLRGPRKVSKTLVNRGMSEEEKIVGYANVYKWLLQNKECLG